MSCGDPRCRYGSLEEIKRSLFPKAFPLSARREEEQLDRRRRAREDAEASTQQAGKD